MPKPPEGLPGYGWESLLKKCGMATVTMLRQERRQVADGQKPVGYYWSGHDYALLYATADAVAMPPLSPGRQAQYDRNRTCAECGAKAREPFQKGRDGKRYCEPHQGPVHERLWRQERAADRPVVTAWARGVLDDPTVILGGERRQQWYRDIHLADLAGTVLLDAKVRYSTDNRIDPGWLTRDHFAGTVSPAELADTVRGLVGRRLITWWPWNGPHLHAEFDEDGRGVGDGLAAASEDILGRWYTRWVGKAAGSSYRHHPRLADQSPPWEAAEQAARMREVLDEMAAGGEPQ